jgi:hypothetical protein
MSNLPSIWLKNFDLLENTACGVCILSSEMLFSLLENSEKVVEWT